MSASMVSHFAEAYGNRHDLAREWKRQGRKVFGLLYGKIPEEILYAADIIPVHLMEDRQRGSYLRGKECLDRFYCDYAINILGQVLQGTYDYLDGVVMYDACETAKMLAGTWYLRKEMPFFYWLICCEETTGGAKVFFTKELAHFRGKIEEFTGRKISDERLVQAIEIYNENRTLMRRLYELRHEKLGLLSEREFFDVFLAGLVLPKEEHNGLLNGLLAEVSEKSGDGNKGPRLLLSCVIAEECVSSETDIVSIIEEAGGNIVCDDLCFGPGFYWEPTRLESDPIAALVNRYLGGMPMPFKTRSDQWTDLLLAEAKRQGAQGAIFVIPKYCTPYLWDYPYLESRLSEMGFPTLMLEGEEHIPEARTRTRIEAFLETLVGKT